MPPKKREKKKERKRDIDRGLEGQISKDRKRDTQ